MLLIIYFDGISSLSGLDRGGGCSHLLGQTLIEAVIKLFASMRNLIDRSMTLKAADHRDQRQEINSANKTEVAY